MSEEIGNTVVVETPKFENVYHYEKGEYWGDVGKLVEALTKAQAEFTPVRKSSNNPFFKSKYADLSEVIDATRPALTKHGVAVVQLAAFENGKAKVTTLVLHGNAGIRGVLEVPIAKQDAQGVGAGLTYARRFAYQAAVGVAAEDDDDGNTATGKRTGDPVEDGETPLRGIGGIIKAQYAEENGMSYSIFDPATKRTITLKVPEEAMGSSRLIDQLGKYVGVKARPITTDKDCVAFVLHDVVNVRNDDPPQPVAQQIAKPQGVGSPKTITDGQRKRLWAIAKSKELSETHLRDLLGRYGYESTGEVQSKDYEKICADIDPTLAK